MVVNDGREEHDRVSRVLSGQLDGRAGRSSRQQLRASSAQLQAQVSWLLGALVVTVLLERYGAVLMEVVKAGAVQSVWQHLAQKTLVAVPEAMYLLSLWWIRQALGEFAAGALFSPLVVRLLNRTGSTLAAGALFTVVVLPTLSWIVGAAPGYLLAYDPSSAVLGAIGLSLRVLAGAFERAAELQTELDEIF